MAKLEIQLGADSAELLRELSASEKLLKDWVSRVNTLKPKVSSTGIVEYSKETNGDQVRWDKRKRHRLSGGGIGL